jgi:predicted RNA-binding Zn-ribbon protein involved in translation (DUF1610 family)
MIRFLICTRCGLVLAVGTNAKKTTCPKCQAPATARPDTQVATKAVELEVAA